MSKHSLAKAVIGSQWLQAGLLAPADGSLLKGFEMDPLPSGRLEEGLEGPEAMHFYSKLADLLTRLPNRFKGQIMARRRQAGEEGVPGYITRLYLFEQVANANSYSYLAALLEELTFIARPLSASSWRELLEGFFGGEVKHGRIPDTIWERDCLRLPNEAVRALSLTELPQTTWKGCFQTVFEYPGEFVVSMKLSVPDRSRTKRTLETKRRVSHALSVTTSLEVRNIESNSVLSSSEETLERILVGKETLFEVSMGIFLRGGPEETLATAREFERHVCGIGNAGLFREEVGTLPVVRSHIPGNQTLGVRTVPILSENLAHLIPLLHDYSRQNDPSSLQLRSRSGETAHLNLFSKENLNFNSFICGASGSGKSFLMNAMLVSTLHDVPGTRLCIFDVGGSYRRIVESSGGRCTCLTREEAISLIATFLRLNPISSKGFYRSLIETLCGSGPHITHSHLVAIDDVLRDLEGERLSIVEFTKRASGRSERFYQDLAHWLKPHSGLDDVPPREDLIAQISSAITAYDFKGLDTDPVLQRTTILLLSELLWRDLMKGHHPRTLIVFDEVWKFFSQSRNFLEEMYRTLRKYNAGIVSITQNLADYGDETFSKMLFTNSFTKIFLQNGASGEFLKHTFDLPESDIQRALSVASKKPQYSEFFALSPNLSQVFRLYATSAFYSLANTENIHQS